MGPRSSRALEQRAAGWLGACGRLLPNQQIQGAEIIPLLYTRLVQSGFLVDPASLCSSQVRMQSIPTLLRTS